jgi:hypothetical protein
MEKVAEGEMTWQEIEDWFELEGKSDIIHLGS